MDSKKEETIAKFLQTIEKLYYLEEFSVDEIAHIVNVPVENMPEYIRIVNQEREAGRSFIKHLN